MPDGIFFSTRVVLTSLSSTYGSLRLINVALMAAYAFFCNISIFCVGFKPISSISFKIRTLFAVSCVACILMHERITHGTLFTTFRAFMISCNKLHATRSVIPYCSVHLDARMISPLCRMKCGNFWACFFVQQVARYGVE